MYVYFVQPNRFKFRSYKDTYTNVSPNSVVFSPDKTFVFIRELVPALPAPAVHHVPGLPGLDLVRALAEDRDLEAVQALAATLGSD